MKKNKPKIGDIFEMTLSDNRRAYGQFVYWDKKMGPIVQIFDLKSSERLNLDRIKDAKVLFPPVFTGLFAAIKSGLWQVIGNIPVQGFIYPTFISNNYNQKTGEAGPWFLWDGDQWVTLGTKLSDAQKKLEFLMGWNPANVMERIETGEIPFPYRDLIQNNKFMPRSLSEKPAEKRT